MFNIKRYDAESGASKGLDTQQSTAQDRLAKLNARLNKNKSKTQGDDTTNTKEPHKEQATPVQQPHTQTDTNKKNKGKRDHHDGEPTSNKRSREHEETNKKHGKKWEKRAKELKDSDLIPNDVRMAMKAEAEAEAAGSIKGTPKPTTAAPTSTLAAVTESVSMDLDMEDKEKTNDSTEMTDPDGGYEIDGVKQFMDDTEADAALADIAALIPLPTFEAKEISVEERERAKSMGVPDWLAHPTKIDPDTNTAIDASMFGFSQRLVKQCKKAGIQECFAVQTAVIPVLMRSRHLGDIRKAPGDLCVSAPTGSGKTLAYVLPIIEILSQRVVTRLRALVVLPTRDLCIQVKETFETFIKGTDLKIATSTGQNSFVHEQNILVGESYVSGPRMLGGHSRVDVLITTPGRLIDHIKSTPNFTLQHLRFLVIDEADRLLNQSFQDWLYHILTAIHPSPEKRSLGADGSETIQLKRDQYGFPIHDAIAPGFLDSFFRLPESDVQDPKAVSVQKLLFSATLTRNPAKIASLQLSNPQYVAVQEGGDDGDDKQKYTTPAGLTEHMIVCESSEKPLMVLHLLHHLKVRSALCFTKSVESAHRLSKLLQLYERSRTTSSPKAEAVSESGTIKAKDEKKPKVDNDEEMDSDSDSDSSGTSDSDNSDGEEEEEEEEEGDNGDEEEAGEQSQSDIEMEDAKARVRGSDLTQTTDIEMDSIQPTTEAIVVAEYSSDLPKSRRQAILRAFNKGEIHLLICSDLISRGMDLAPVSVVINYDTPIYMKKYIHRVGRTARAGKTGTAYTLVEMQEARHFKEMVTKAGHWEKISRIKVKDQEVKDLVPGYTKALSGLKEALTSAKSSKRIGRRRMQRS
ncbi:P-loop containing nucleoside triphosphate hydrolase protein [Mortierella sp. GBAus27b]|nr:ATP-dependent RNA helicase dbp6 [Mortierella sp. GBA43]KAI8353806.1 P-loop containing nucleoside triphosphate hydrolase protein [Mortierella sp. GBAus27b]